MGYTMRIRDKLLYLQLELLCACVQYAYACATKEYKRHKNARKTRKTDGYLWYQHHTRQNAELPADAILYPYLRS